MVYAALICRTVVGLVFAVSAFSKLRNATAYREFASWLAGVPVPLARNRTLPPVLAAAEAATVVLVAVPATAVAGLVLAVLVLAALTAGTAVVVRRGARVTCQCFGPSQTELASHHVLRNGFLLVVAAVGLAAVAFSVGAAGPRPAGIGLSLWAAVAVATFVVFLDDVVFLVSGDHADRAKGAGLT
jgi:hypothetical protein